MVGDARQALARVVVAVGDRLVGDVAARHHERRRGVVREQVVQRRVGQHHAELAVARGDRRRHGRVGAPRREHDRPLAPGQQLRLGVAQLDERPRRRDVAHHERERPVLAVLARAQSRDRLLVVGAAREVVAAEALDGHDRAVEQGRGGQVHRVVAGRLPQPHGRTARRARVGLRVEAPVARVVVLGPARGAHREAGHRRQRPVVGHAAHDREARAAVRAVDERVAVAAVGGIEELGQAVGAGGRVGGDRRVGLAAVGALEDAKAQLPGGRQRRPGDRLDARQRRRLGGQPGQEALDRLAARPRPRAARRARR